MLCPRAAGPMSASEAAPLQRAAQRAEPCAHMMLVGVTPSGNLNSVLCDKLHCCKRTDAGACSHLLQLSWTAQCSAGRSPPISSAVAVSACVPRLSTPWFVAKPAATATAADEAQYLMSVTRYVHRWAVLVGWIIVSSILIKHCGHLLPAAPMRAVVQ